MDTWRDLTFFNINDETTRRTEMDRLKARWTSALKYQEKKMSDSRVAFLVWADAKAARALDEADRDAAFAEYKAAELRAGLGQEIVAEVLRQLKPEVARLDFINVALAMGISEAEIQDLMVPAYNESSNQATSVAFRAAIRKIDPASPLGFAFNSWLTF
jgi:hypothetical protein